MQFAEVPRCAKTAADGRTYEFRVAGTGFTFSVPAGKQNSLRISYFRVTGSGDTVAASDLALFSVGYTAGDFLTTKYKLQNVKL